MAADVAISAVDTFLDAVRASTLYADTGSTVDLLDFSLRLLAEIKHPSAALARLVAMSESDDLPPMPSLCKWSDAEKEELGKQLALHGDDLASAIQSFPGRTLFQLVHLFYRTAGHAVPDHSIHKQVHDIADPTLAVASSVIVPAPHIDAESADPAAAGAPVDTLSSQAENAPDDDDTISHKSLDLGSTADRACAICQKAQAVKWYKCPDGLGEASEVPKQKVMCPSCSTQWRRCDSLNSELVLACLLIADFIDGDSLPALTPEELDARAARDGKMRQRRSLLQRGLDLTLAPSETASGETSRADTPNLETAGALSAKLGRSGSQIQQGPKKVGRPVPPPLMQPKSAVGHGETLPDGALPASPNVLPTPLCVLCKRTEPKHQSYSCKDCGVVCHSGCYGIFSASATEDWQCDGCASGVSGLRARKTYAHAIDLSAAGGFFCMLRDLPAVAKRHETCFHAESLQNLQRWATSASYLCTVSSGTNIRRRRSLAQRRRLGSYCERQIRGEVYALPDKWACAHN